MLKSSPMSIRMGAGHCKSGNKTDTAVFPNGHRIFREITEPITTFSSACYRLCVYASGSLTTVIFSLLTLIRLSLLHLGQKRGKLRNSVSLLTLVRVLHPQVGHNIHSKPLPLIGIPALSGEPPILIQQNIKFILNQSVFSAVQI